MSWPQWPTTGVVPTWSGTVAPTGTAISSGVTPLNTPGTPYTPEQWAAMMQQQNWQQWMQWQQQYQQWQQQYGEQYQKSMSALAGQTAPFPVTPVQPPLPVGDPTVPVPAPLPEAEMKPPLPPSGDAPAFNISIPPPNVPPPPPAENIQTNTFNQSSNQNLIPNRNVAPPSLLSLNIAKPPELKEREKPTKRNSDFGDRFNDSKKNRLDGNNKSWNTSQAQSQSQSQKNSEKPVPPRPKVEELSEAEKNFDKQFEQWEQQFNKWKDQNVGHPDKQQYKQYEAKWESWRAQLLERREQMRRKRLGIVASVTIPSPNSTPKQNEPIQKPVTPVPSVEETETKKSETNMNMNQDDIMVLFTQPPKEQRKNVRQRRTSSTKSDSDSASIDSFLKTNITDGIPGLDLVKNPDDKLPDESVRKVMKLNDKIPAPDLEAISKGINTILGDEKFLNMLSMVSQNKKIEPEPESADNNNSNDQFGFNNSKQFNRPDQFRGQFEFSDNSKFGNQNEDTNQNLNDGSHQNFGPNRNRNDAPFQGQNGPNDFTGSNFNQDLNQGYQNPENNQPFRDSNFNEGPGNRNVNRGAGNQNNQGPQSDFNRRPLGRGDNDFNQDNFNNPRSQWNRGQDFNQDPPNRNDFNQGPPNRNDFNQGPPDRNDFNQGPRNRNDFNQGPPNRNDFNQGFQNQNDFNQGPQNRNDFNQGPQNRNDFNQGRQNRNDFNQGPPNRNNFNQGPQNRNDFNEGPPNRNDFNQGPPNRNDFNEGPQHWNGPRGNNFNQGPSNWNGPRGNNFNQGPPGPQNQNRSSENFNNRSNWGNDYNQDFSDRNYDYDEGNEARFSETEEDPYANEYEEYENYDDQEGRNSSDFNQTNRFGPGSGPGFDDRSGSSSDLCRNWEAGNCTRRWSEGSNQNQNQNRNFGNGGGGDSTNKYWDEALILKPATVVDYGHKSQNKIETDTFIEPVQTFDYGHNSKNVKDMKSLEFPQRNADFNRRPVEAPRPPKISAAHSRYDDNKMRVGFKTDNNYNKKNNSNNNSGGSGSSDNNNRTIRERKQQQQQQQDQFANKCERDKKNEFNTIIVKCDELQSSGPSSSASPVTMIEDLLSPPGRDLRPPRIVIVLRGPPGSGKTFLAKLIKDKEVEHGGSAPRILSLDDYFMVEQDQEVTESETGRKTIVKQMVYEYEECMEVSYRQSLERAFKKTVTDGFFPFIILDCINDKVKHFGEMWSFAKQNGFQVYVCQLELDVMACTKRNVHHRSEVEIERLVANWEQTPKHYLTLDATSLIQAGCISEVEMEEVVEMEDEENEDKDEGHGTVSKWERMEHSGEKLARLDGISKPLRHRTMEDYLQLEEDEVLPEAKPGQKRVSWADLEERRRQDKIRAIGFVVGQTDWDRMMDPTQGGSALTQTKYIERVKRF